jgi:hypothetical protein
MGILMFYLGTNLSSAEQTNPDPFSGGLSVLSLLGLPDQQQLAFQMQIISWFLLPLGIFFSIFGGVMYPKKPIIALSKSKNTEDVHNPKDLNTKFKKISTLKRNILKQISMGSDTQTIIDKVGVKSNIINKMLSNLQTNGYVTRDGYLTEKGFDYLHKSEKTFY